MSQHGNGEMAWSQMDGRAGRPPWILVGTVWAQLGSSSTMCVPLPFISRGFKSIIIWPKLQDKVRVKCMSLLTAWAIEGLLRIELIGYPRMYRSQQTTTTKQAYVILYIYSMPRIFIDPSSTLVRCRPTRGQPNIDIFQQSKKEETYDRSSHLMVLHACSSTGLNNETIHVLWIRA